MENNMTTKEKIKVFFKKIDSVSRFLFLLTFVIVFAEVLNYNQQKDMHEILTKAALNEKFNENFKKLYVTLNDTLIAPTTKDIYTLQKDLVEINQKYTELNTLVDSKHNDWLAYFANFWVVFGLVIDSLAVVFSYRSKVIEEVNKQVGLEVGVQVDKIVKEEVAKLTGEEVDFIRQNLKQFEKQLTLRKDSKIIILNKENTKLPPSFRVLLRLFDTDIDDTENRVDLPDLQDALSKENLRKLRTADLVLIENMVPDCEWKPIDENYKEIYRKLANKICDKTALLYYGSGNPANGRFPAEKVDEDKQHLINFANSPAQLYGNLLSLLNYRFEVKNWKKNNA